FSDAAGTVPVLTSDTTDGFAFTANVNLDGTTAADNFSAQTSVSTAVPEPSTLLLVLVGACIVFGMRRIQRSTRRQGAVKI
ncbi:MAG: PEP-CTERM sorting domain-containing protein, partial [Bryobacteraceae bacterium]